MDYAQWRNLLAAERLPAAAVDLDAFDRNLAALAAMADPGVATGTSRGARRLTIRLATKSVRVPELLRRALGAPGTPFRGLMTYSAEETAFLAREGFDDFLLAYPTLRDADVKALREVHESGKKVRAVIDSREGAAALARGMRGCARPFAVVLEVDMSLRLLGLHLGVRRSPLRTAADVMALMRAIRAEHAGALELEGLMAYEAQVAGLGDRNPFKRLLNPIAHLIRTQSAKQVARRRTKLARAFSEVTGAPPRLFNGGGTGSLTYAAGETALTELAAGSGLLNPHLFDYYSNFHLEPAAFFALQVVRSSDPRIVTCQGGGYIASGEPGLDRLPRPYLPEGLKLVSMEGAGEVQTPLIGRNLPALGEPAIFRHAKAGELFERFNECLLIQGGKITGRVPTYRGLGRCYF